MAPLATILRPHEQLARIGSAGRASLNVETRIVDDDGAPVPPGTVGEIVHRSPQATLGYWNDAAKTAEAFQGGWFHSGDLGVMDADGYLAVVDRKKDMIKSGGENVASREVEEAMFEHPAVAEVAVFGIPHPYWVEAVTAVVVPKAGATVTADELLEHARGRLAGYKRPKYVELVDALPEEPERQDPQARPAPDVRPARRRRTAEIRTVLPNRPDRAGCARTGRVPPSLSAPASGGGRSRSAANWPAAGTASATRVAAERLPRSLVLRQTVTDHVQGAGVEPEPDVAAADLHVLVAIVGDVEADLPAHDPVGPAVDRRRGNRERSPPVVLEAPERLVEPGFEEVGDRRRRAAVAVVHLHAACRG